MFYALNFDENTVFLVFTLPNKTVIEKNKIKKLPSKIKKKYILILAPVFWSGWHNLEPS